MSQFSRYYMLFVVSVLLMLSCKDKSKKTFEIAPIEQVEQSFEVTERLTKKLVLEIDNPGKYAGLSVFADDDLLIDDINIPEKGKQTITSIVKFKQKGNTSIKFQSFDEKITILSYHFEEIEKLIVPEFHDISKQVGLEKVSSIKYGGPSVADIDNDGDYDFIVNNHNAETSKLYWNNGDGTVTRHTKDLARWFKHDLHGTALGDYDNDGDLDLVLTQGGGNGKNPSKANFYLNDTKTLVRYTGDVGIERGGRGRGAKWMDLDLDGDLDLMLVNEASLKHDKPQHFFYENKGDGTFTYRSIKGVEDVEESRVLVTDFNNDNIDDLVLYGPLKLWKGNGDFTFTDVTSEIPEHVRSLKQVMAVTDIDIDNDGDLDFYLARGKLFEHGKGEAPSLDFNPLTKELAIKTRGYKNTDAFEFTAEDAIKLHKYYYLAQGSFLGKDYPVFLGEKKVPKIVKSTQEKEFEPEMAKGWPEDISENGFYLGYLGDGKWKAALVRDAHIFWQYRFSLSGVTNVKPLFEPENRNCADVLLRNDNGKFVDVSAAWNIPKGGNALGVTVGDFNNDSHQDLFIYRWGRIGARISDVMLLNSGKESFEATTAHGANDIGGPGNGDMGQAFDFDLDGHVDLLNGSEGGEWYLYKNKTKNGGNYAIVKVGYSPKSNIDPISAEVIVKTTQNTFRKRVGSAGAIFSQSLINMIHFGLGDEKKIEKITVRWRNGETVMFKNKEANATYDTNKLDPEQLALETVEVRKGTKMPLSIHIQPKQANKEVKWLSSDESIVTVDKNGVITAHGNPNQSAMITVISKANGLATKNLVKIVEWKPILVKSIRITANEKELYEGESLQLQIEALPKYADNSELVWSSNNTKVLTVDANGKLKANAAGKATITVRTKDNTVHSKVLIIVKPYHKPYIEITNKAQFDTKPLIIGNKITVQVKYHAGSRNRVIAADEGGVRFWLRHFQSKWIPKKDIVLTFKEALNKESGKASMTFSLEDLIPTKELPEGHFYQLRATFTSSDGNMYTDDILPLQIVDKK